MDFTMSDMVACDSFHNVPTSEYVILFTMSGLRWRCVVCAVDGEGEAVVMHNDEVGGYGCWSGWCDGVGTLLTLWKWKSGSVFCCVLLVGVPCLYFLLALQCRYTRNSEVERRFV